MRNRERPLVSVIVPAYNAAQFIERTLASAQQQTYQNTEIIVVDDGSEDETAALVEAVAARDARVQLLRQPNQGVAAARNHALSRAQGTFIAPLDADDLWFPQKLELQVQRMEETGPSTGLVYTWWVGISENDHLAAVADRWTIEGDVYEALIYRNFVGNASVPLFRRACLEAVGGYDATLRAQGAQGCEDWDLTLRVAERYSTQCVPAYLTAYRTVGDSMSQDFTSMGRSYDLVMDAAEQQHPEIAPKVFQWSRSNFYLYLASLSYDARNFRQVLYWMQRVMRVDPAAPLSPWVLDRVVRGVLRHAAQPLRSFFRADRRAVLHFKDRVTSKQAEHFSLARINEDAPSVPASWAWGKPRASREAVKPRRSAAARSRHPESKRASDTLASDPNR